MLVLIVESDPSLAEVWKRHLERMGASVCVASSQDEAIDRIQHDEVDIIVLDLVVAEGSAIAIADYASYRKPMAKVIFVTNTTFFSDGSIFNHIPNACAFVESQTPPDDLAAIVEHYGRAV